MKIEFSSISVLLAAFAPLIGLVVAIIFDRERRKKSEKPPQTEKLLRPPGYSLSLRREKVLDSAVDQILVSCGFAAIAGLCVVVLDSLLAVNAPPFYLFVCGLVLLLFVIVSALSAVRAFGSVKEGQNIRLGISGEQAVAEALGEAADSGFRAFHDLEDEKVGNIDHVAVGTRGVFLIETKARRRRARRNVQPEHEVIFDGDCLQFPTGIKESKPIEQAKRNAAWLANYLGKKTGEPVRVEPLVVLPGWFVRIAERGNFPVKAMNANYLVRYLQSQPETLEPAQVRRIITALDDKCRTIEF